jgi:integrase
LQSAPDRGFHGFTILKPTETRTTHKSFTVSQYFPHLRKKAGIENFTFHDLRHTAINNWRLRGHDFFRIMAASGHKTMNVFKRYNTVSKEELKALVGEN